MRLEIEVLANPPGRRYEPAPAGILLEAGYVPESTPRDAVSRPVVLPGVEVVGTGITDAEGRARIELEAPPPDGSRRVYVRPAGPGWQRLAATAELESEEGPLGIRLLLRPGGSLSGRVVSPEGEPVAAQVVLLDPGSGRWVGRASLASTDGSFLLHHDGTGTVDLHARASGIGAGIVAGIEVTDDGSVPEVTVRLSGSGTLSGRVTDPAGRPVPGLPLVASSDRVDRLPSFAGGWDAEGKGLATDTKTTDLEGRFRFGGLAPGSYGIEKLNEGPSPLADPRRFRTGDEDLHLLDGATYLQVRIRRESASSTEAAPARLTCLRATSGRAPAGQAPWRQALRNRLEPEDGSVLFEVEPGAEYVVGAVAPGSVAEELVQVPPSVHRVEQELVLGPERPTGTLFVELEAPDGSPYGGPRQVDLRLGLGTSVRRPKDVQDRLVRRPIAVPEGVYELSVTSEFTMQCGNGPPVGPEHPLALRSVEILAGQEQTIRVRLQPKGTLRIRRPDAEAAAVRLELLPLDAREGEARPILPVLAVEEPFQPFGRTTTGVPPGSVCRTLTPLLPGRYRVLIDGRPTGTVEIRADRTTELELQDRALRRGAYRAPSPGAIGRPGIAWRPDPGENPGSRRLPLKERLPARYHFDPSDRPGGRSASDPGGL